MYGESETLVSPGEEQKESSAASSSNAFGHSTIIARSNISDTTSKSRMTTTTCTFLSVAA